MNTIKFTIEPLRKRLHKVVELPPESDMFFTRENRECWSMTLSIIRQIDALPEGNREGRIGTTVVRSMSYGACRCTGEFDQSHASAAW